MNKTKTLYISDLDGTLLNKNSVVSETTCGILNRLIAENGLLFSVATARTPATVVNLLSGINSKLPYIVMTGAAMWRGNGLVNRHYLRLERLELILEQCRLHGVHPFIYSYNEDDNIIEAWHSAEMSGYEKAFMEQRIGSPFKRFVISDNIPEDVRKRVMLIFAAAGYEVMRGIYDNVFRLPCSMTCYRDIFDSSVGFLEAMAEGVSKASAIEELKKETAAERIVVFGDSPNDLSMRQVADMFIAPANAAADVKAVADLVIGSNDDDCVARWIAGDIAG